MYKSASTSRVSADRSSGYTSSPKSKGSPILRALSLEAATELPVQSQEDVSKKDRARAKFAENAVHLIPLVLLLCAFILWFLSNPNIDVQGNATTIINTEGGITNEGDLDSDGTGHLPVELGDLDPSKLRDSKTLFSENKSR